MAKASRVLAALKKDGWVEVRRSGSHRMLEKAGNRRVWAHHDGTDLGGPMMSKVAKAFGYTVDEIGKLI